MKFSVGLAFGMNYWISIKCSSLIGSLEIQEERIILSDLIRSIYLDKQDVVKLHYYKPLLWTSEGIRIEHRKRDVSQFLCFWAFDLRDIITTLRDNGFDCLEGF